MDIFLPKSSIVGHSMTDDLNDFGITIAEGEFSLHSLASSQVCYSQSVGWYYIIITKNTHP